METWNYLEKQARRENKLLPLVFKAFSYILLIENYRYCSLVKKLTNLNKF